MKEKISFLSKNVQENKKEEAGVCVIVQQTEGQQDNLSSRVDGQHVFVSRNRQYFIDLVVKQSK